MVTLSRERFTIFSILTQHYYTNKWINNECTRHK